jgi:hypothetical protein
MKRPRQFVLLSMVLFALSAYAGEEQAAPATPEGMNNARIGALLEKLNLQAVGGDGKWRLVLNDREVIITTNESANRMRIFTPVVGADELTEAILLRVMQANFDSALDARYAIAKGALWSTFIHPLRALDDEEFLQGLGQVYNLANTFGSSYSSGLLLFEGGDSSGIQEKELIDDLVEKGLAI